MFLYSRTKWLGSWYPTINITCLTWRKVFSNKALARRILKERI
jgi:hypothetical protein